MPSYEAAPNSRTLISAGWTNPANAYLFNGSYTYSETDNAEEEYDGYNFPLTGNEVIDRVFVKIKDQRKVTTVVQGDGSGHEGYIRVYNGSAWTNYQVTADDFAVTTANDESLTSQSGDASNSQHLIDVTATIDTVAKLQNTKTRLLHNISLTAAGITQRWSIDAITMLVCYSYSDSVPATGKATTKKEKPKELKTIKQVSDALKIVSQSHT